MLAVMVEAFFPRCFWMMSVCVCVCTYMEWADFSANCAHRVTALRHGMRTISIK